MTTSTKQKIKWVQKKIEQSLQSLEEIKQKQSEKPAAAKGKKAFYQYPEHKKENTTWYWEAWR